MFSTVVPLRTIVLQIVFLLVAIAVEAVVLRRFLKLAPKQSVQYATSLNLFCTVVGWVAFFVLFGLLSNSVSGLDVNFLNFIFFDRWSGEVAASLIMIGFLMFFASFAVKQFGLILLQRFLEGPKKEDKPAAPPPESTPEPAAEPRKVIRVMRRETLEVRQMQPGFRAVLLANAWSFSAILVILLLRLLFRQALVA